MNDNIETASPDVHHAAREDYRREFYARYRSTHVVPRKGETTAASHERRFASWERLLGPYIPSARTARIVDLGCGDGAIVHWLRHKGYTQVVGVDFSQEEVDAAQRLGLPVECMEINQYLAAAPASFDFVVLRNVIEHNFKPEILQLLALIHRSLVDGGSLFIQAPNGESPFGSRIRYGDFTHELAFTASSISQLLRVCGFRDIQVGPVEPLLRGRRRLAWGVAKRMYQWLLYAEVGVVNAIVTQDLHAAARR